ncbi:MAG: prepilin-type N-terminal cleavage/methylation domain-containing protein [Bacilli bacterium]
MKKKNGFTLVELLAVIVILAIILVIAVPQIMNTIKDARKGSFESSAKLIASNAETYWLTKQTLGETLPTTAACADLASLSADYGTCTVTIDNAGKAKVSLAGAEGGKFDGCTVTDATKDAASATGGNCGA